MSNLREKTREGTRFLLVNGALAILIAVVAGTRSMNATPAQDLKASSISSKSKLGSIAGRITIEREPANGLVVSLHPRHGHIVDKEITTVSTDAEGRYRFINTVPGHYWIRVETHDYVAAAGVQYNGPGSSVSLGDGGAVTDGDVDLIPCGVVSGRILDSQGEPVPNEHVFVSPSSQKEPHGQVYLQANGGESFKTDADGHYRLYGVPPGRYLVGVGIDIPRVSGEIMEGNDFRVTGHVGGDHYYAETYYPGTTDRSAAYPVDVRSGSEVSGIDVTVGRRFRTFAVSGRVIDAESGEPIRNCYIELGNNAHGGYAGMYRLNGPSDTDDDGRFLVRGLMPGWFYVNGQFLEPSDLYATPVHFEVKDGNIEGIEIKAHHGLSIHGTVSIDGLNVTGEIKSRLSTLNLRVSEVENDFELYRESAVGIDGGFDIAGLRPGRYEFALGGVSDYFSLLRVEYADDKGARKTAFNDGDRAFINVGNSGLKDARLVLGYKGGRIKIHVEVKNGRLPAGVLLMAWIGNGRWSSMAELDPNGDFLKEGLLPGEYGIEIGDGNARFAPKKVVKVTDGETRVGFAIDASRIKK